MKNIKYFYKVVNTHMNEISTELSTYFHELSDADKVEVLRYLAEFNVNLLSQELLEIEDNKNFNYCIKLIKEYFKDFG